MGKWLISQLNEDGTMTFLNKETNETKVLEGAEAGKAILELVLGRDENGEKIQSFTA